MTTQHPTDTTAPTVWIGTFPAAGIGTQAGLGEGIWHGTVDEAPGAVQVASAEPVVLAPAPTFLAVHPSGRVVYATHELDEGEVGIYDVGADGASLTVRATVASGGAHPCHLALSRDARTLFAANYSSGTLGVIPLDADGVPTASTLERGRPAQVHDHAGSGPDASRQEGPHAHFTLVVPRERLGDAAADLVLVADLGTDELRRYVTRPDGLLDPAGVLRLPPGTGPRHVALAPAELGPLLYVAGELDSTVHVLRLTGAGAELLQTLPAVAGDVTPSPAGSAPSHVAVVPGPGGEHVATLLLAVRGPDVLSSFVIGPDGLLSPAGTTPTGEWPRHFAVLPARTAGRLAVTIAVERGHEVRTVELDAAGPPQAPQVVLGTPVTAIASPACILPVSRAEDR